MLGEHRHVTALDPLQGERFHRGFLGRGIDGDQLHHALRIFMDVIQIPIGFVADQIAQGRDQHRRFRRDAAPAFRFEALHVQPQAIRGFGEALQIEIEFGFAFIVGGSIGQGFGVALLGQQRIVKEVVWIRRERGVGGKQA